MISSGQFVMVIAIERLKDKEKRKKEATQL